MKKTNGLVMSFNPKDTTVADKFINFLKKSDEEVQKDMDLFLESLIVRFDGNIEYQDTGLNCAILVSFDYTDKESKFIDINATVYGINDEEFELTHELQIHEFNELTVDEFLDKYNEKRVEEVRGYLINC